MKALKIKRGHAKGRITRAATLLDSLDDSISIEMLEIKLSKLDEAWSEFSSLHYECLPLVEEGLEEFEKEFDECEAKYCLTHSGLTRSIRQRQSVNNPKNSDSVLERLANQQSTFLKSLDTAGKAGSNISLPKINVPPFSGCYKDWPCFRDLFTGSVDNQSNLTGTQKFHYLKSFLRDDAANVIKHIPISDANYIEAWDRLEKRYDRVNLIVQSFVQTFLSLPSMSSSNVQVLRRITDGADEVIRGLNALDKNDRDPWLIHLLVTKLDQDTKQAWAEKVGSRDDRSITDLIEFLELRCDALESCQSLNRSVASRGKQSNSIRAHVAKPSDSHSSCPMCKSDHIVPQCSRFIELDVESRRVFVKKNSLCFNCLRYGHSSNRCKSTFRCRVCKARHHSLVHQDDSRTVVQCIQSPRAIKPDASTSQSTNLSATSPSPPSLVSNHSLRLCPRKQTILPTILAKCRNSSGRYINCRVLLDTGSQCSFITESLAQQLGLSRKHSRISVIGLSSKEAGYTRGCMTIQLCSRFESDSLVVDAFILGKLTSNLPSHSFDVSSWEHIQTLELADPYFNTSSAVDMILGADKVWTILKPEQIRGPQGVPVAQKTVFGWVVTGELIDTTSARHELSSFHSVADLDVLLQRFWELEDVPANRANSIINDPAEEHFQKTFFRSADRKYVVSLPFKVPSPSFKDTLQPAISRLHSMERRFKSNPHLHQLYCSFMKEYQELGHMQLIPIDKIHKPCGQYFYLPHHAVLKLDSSTTKLRVVFDGSIKDSRGKSLNSQLLIGPPIQRDLVGVCLRFRQHRYVFTADIVKMFRQIWVREQDLDYQRIVWRENPSEELKHYHLKTVTYGTASAPFLSVRVLKQIADDYKLKYPNAARTLLSDVYVDDVMTGTNSIETLLDLQSELVALLSEANLQLRKWSSNCWALLATKSLDDCEYSFVDPEHSESFIKVLGMFWNPASDVFSYRMTQLKPCSSTSRRKLLSEISSIFDPLGFLAPSTILFKILFQKLWSSELKLGWDDPLPSDLSEKWMTYRNQLPYFKQLVVPRNMFYCEDFVELHGFSDASSVAYAAVVYARCKTRADGFRTTIVAAKTKVAPIKPVSIPRLELCGAVLLTRLLTSVRTSLTVNVSKIYAWCDSEIVLHWLSSPPRRWTTFVANRTAAILENIPRYSWHHIKSESNPADCATRGVIPSDLSGHSLWWSGPSWLSLSDECWPKSKLSLDPVDAGLVNLEERPMKQQVFATYVDGHVIQILIDKISSWSRLQRIVAYCCRFISNCRSNTSEHVSQALSCAEIKAATVIILKFVQFNSFQDDINYLKMNKQLPSKSKLLRYSAFLDIDGLLRVGGRIQHAAVSYNIKHPIIIPKCTNVAPLIIANIHQRYLHAGVSETFAIVRQQFWILGSRNLIRTIIHKCKQCFMQRKLTSQQIMGDLPAERIQPSRPFSNTGCDYAGPLTIKSFRGRKPRLSKAYIALFVCMSTKAIHLEAVTDLTTDAFIAALRRFVSRRGKCINIYTDNGTNFQGARRCLTEMHKLTMSQAHNNVIASTLAHDGITWHFIPPSAPHFGGLWEAGVKSVKLHLRRVIGSTSLTFEELCTVLTQIEAILNSRPLCAISDTDLNPLTPGHFLVGEPLTAVPDPNVLQSPSNRLSHWNYLQSMVQGFWKRWHLEYITTLQERPKWQQPKPNLKPGDLVVIKEPNVPPTKWILGRIEDVSPGADQRVRVATVRTAAGTLIRSVTKLALLPTS